MRGGRRTRRLHFFELVQQVGQRCEGDASPAFRRGYRETERCGTCSGSEEVNTQLKPVVADLTLDKQILRETTSAEPMTSTRQRPRTV